MKLYFVVTMETSFEMLLSEGVQNFIISFMNRKVIEKVKDYKVNLMVDSGAYSVWTKGKKIDLNEYISFCKYLIRNNNLKNLIIVNLDVIPGRFGRRPTREETEGASMEGWENYMKMREAGINAMHIFHQHEDFKWLHKILETDSDYIGISPANDLRTEKRLRWCKKCFSIVKDRKKAHGFGVTDIRILKEIPFYSADSSDWLSLRRWGCIMYYDNLNCKTFFYKRLKDALEFRLNPNALIESRHLDDELRKVVRRFLKMERDITKLWEKRGIKME